MNVLVTGANGFLGRHVVSGALAGGHGVRALDRDPLHSPSGVESFVADLTSGGDLAPLFQRIDVLIHLAASLHGRPEEVVHNTVEGTRRLLEAMGRSGTRRLVLASSLAVYDRAKAGWTIDETSPTHDESSMQACDAYAKAKILQEKLARDVARLHGWALTVLRPAVIWGRNRWGEFLLGRRLGPLQTVVAPSAPARLVYVEHAADAFVRAAERTVMPGEQVINVIDDPVTTNGQFARVLRSRSGGLLVPLPYALGLIPAKLAGWLTGGSTRLPYFLQPARFEALHRPAGWSNRKLRDVLGWAPRYSLNEAAARAMAAAGDP